MFMKHDIIDGAMVVYLARFALLSCAMQDWDIANTRFVIQGLDSVLHDIISCLESDSVVVSFSLSNGFL